MPANLPQHTISTLYLRAPLADWAALTQSHKAEFRMPLRGAASEWYRPPTPVVLYCATPTRTRVHLCMLVSHRKERLIDIAEDGDALIREGFETYEDFKRYWRKRTRKPYDAAKVVDVFQITPTWPGWEAQAGCVLLERLYDEFLP